MKRLTIICLAVLIGMFSAFSFPTLVILGAAVYVIYRCRENTLSLEEKRFITYACALAMGIRIAVSLFILAYARYSGIGSDIFGDAMNYESVGLYIREIVTGMPIRTGIWGDNLLAFFWLRHLWQKISLPRLMGLYTLPGISFWYGYFNVLWGCSLLGPKILNGLMWIIGSYWIYLFFRERFPQSGIKLGLLIILFLPSSLIFSSSGLKDSLIFLLLTMVIFSSHMLERFHHRWYAGCALLITPLLGNLLDRFGMLEVGFVLISFLIINLFLVLWNKRLWVCWGVLIVCAGLLLPILRTYVNILVSLFGICILARNLNLRKIFMVISLILIFASIVSGGRIAKGLYDHFQAVFRSRISESVLQSYNTAYGRSAFHTYPGKFYAAGADREAVAYREVFFSYLNGLRYLFLEPTPWSFRSPFTIVMFPETLLVWLFMPFIMVGSIVILRLNRPIALATILYLFLMTSLLVLGQSNMGTLVRTRSMIMPWYFMIGALGFSCTYSWVFESKINNRE